MIKYRLVCAADHEFEGWFRSSGAFDEQSGAGIVACPACGSTNVQKDVMAPAVTIHSRRPGDETPPAAKSRPPSQAQHSQHLRNAAATSNLPAQAREIMRQLRAEIEKNAEYVGPRFAEEARRIHYKEAPARGIYGEASGEEVTELHEEGVEVFPIPALPEDQN